MREDFLGYHCSVCGTRYQPDEVTYTCPKDGGNLDVVLDYSGMQEKVSPQDILAAREESLWRYLPLLPVSDPGGYGTPLRSAGWTKVYQPPKLIEATGVKKLWVKDESTNPTASFKDRASAILIARAQEIEAETIVTASTGNAGAALAGMAAAVGHRAVIFAPKAAPPAKIAQLLVFGAEVILVDGTYDDAFDLAVAAANKFGWYCRNTGYNPFTAEGKKTVSFEIWEQVLYPNKLTGPVNIFISVGDGNIIAGAHKGFKDLMAMGWIEEMPRLFGVQSTGSAAISHAFDAKTEEIIPVSAKTLADSISVDLPRDGLRALRAATHTRGAYVQVEDAKILEAIAILGKVGIFAEPAGATAYAGFLQALSDGHISKDDPTIIVNTGSGLKDIGAATKAVGEAPIIHPDMDALEHYLAQRK
jgi:threonine synthase